MPSPFQALVALFTTDPITINITDGSITDAKLASVTGPTLKGKVSGTGAPTNLTPTQATALLDLATDSVKGLLPTLSGDDTEFLNGDGAWAVPAGGGGGQTYTPNGLIADSTTVTADDTETIFSNGTKTIPGGTLVARGLIHIMAVMRVDGMVAAGDVSFRLYLNGLAGIQLSAITVHAEDDYVILDFYLKIREIGASGKLTGTARSYYLDNGSPEANLVKTPAPLTVDTTASITIDCAVVHSSNSADTQTVLEQFDVIPHGFSW